MEGPACESRALDSDSSPPGGGDSDAVNKQDQQQDSEQDPITTAVLTLAQDPVMTTGQVVVNSDASATSTAASATNSDGNYFHEDYSALRVDEVSGFSVGPSAANTGYGGFPNAFEDMPQQINYSTYRNTDSASPYERITPPSSEAAMYPHHSQTPPNGFPVAQNVFGPSNLHMRNQAILRVGGAGGGPLFTFGGKIGQNRHSHDVDEVKLAKKRERNRIAATKCRQRKLEKISTLEKEVADLKRENDNLRRERQKLTADLARMRADLDKHLEQGCPLATALGLDVPSGGQAQAAAVQFYQDQSSGGSNLQ